MAAPLTECALLDELEREGVAVVETNLDGAMWGYYDHLHRTIYLQAGMTAGHRLATLLHEAVHHRRGDSRPQPDCVEDRIDEEVARALVNPGEYGFWESELGWCTGGIAAALDLPKWVVRAYRRMLERAA